MTPVELLLSKLPDARRNCKGWVARCPAHDDRHASLSVAEGDAGRALVYCHAGCTAEVITAALGLKMADLMPPNDPPQKKPPAGRPRGETTTTRVYQSCNAAVQALENKHGPRAALWTYYNAGGEPVGAVVRWNLAEGGKDIRPVRANHS